MFLIKADRLNETQLYLMVRFLARLQLKITKTVLLPPPCLSARPHVPALTGVQSV
jgi:hypothetical protein